MRRLTSVLALLLLVLPSWAADEPKANTLTAKEIADGWLLLFDGETTFGWKIDGEAKVDNGTLILGGDRDTTAVFTTQFGAVEVRFLYAGEGTDQVKFFPVTQDKPKGYDFPLAAGKKGWVSAGFQVSKKEGVTSSFVLDGKAVGLAPKLGDQDELSRVQSALNLQVPKGVRLSLRNVVARPLDLKPIFDGKDLTGWKEHPNKKSKFSVTKEGWINIKDGPGDLQTEDQWDDFVLQIECISNGKHLNSGVFFRCRPNEYQQGYEAQIHNGFTAEPMKEYKLLTYDPETGKVVDTKTAKYAATDYGTGAIYNRQPARKQLSKDNEWFTMTVVAQGRHLATWVNGVQVVDWTDTRPVKDNARNGCKLEKGHISLQGHDPTTDLSFRNIRIAELTKPAEKK